jgi:hypothetical protein
MLDAVSGYEMRRAAAGAVTLGGVCHCAGDVRMARQRQVVVAAEVDRAPSIHAHARPLGCGVQRCERRAPPL